MPLHLVMPIPRNIRDPKVSNHHSHPKSSKSSNFSGISLASTKWPGFVWRYGVHGTQIAQASSRSTIYANGLSTTPSVAMMTEKFVTRSWVQFFKSRSNHSHCLLNCLLPIFWCLDPKYSKMVVGATESKSKIAWAPPDVSLVESSEVPDAVASTCSNVKCSFLSFFLLANH